MDPMGYHIFVFSDKPNCWSIFVRGSIASKLAGGLVVLREKNGTPKCAMFLYLKFWEYPLVN